MFYIVRDQILYLANSQVQCTHTFAYPSESNRIHCHHDEDQNMELTENQSHVFSRTSGGFRTHLNLLPFRHLIRVRGYARAARCRASVLFYFNMKYVIFSIKGYTHNLENLTCFYINNFYFLERLSSTYSFHSSLEC